MCGICGIVTNKSATEREQRVAAMIRSLSHRGPDGSGIWSDSSVPVSLGHARLAILDLSDAGIQPMRSYSGRYTIVYNGELYNYPDLKAELEKTGTRFRGSSDTEVFLEAIEAYGIESALQKANGMFALAIWDSVNQQLTLARDRLGIKPLFFGKADGAFFFSSELKAAKAAQIPLKLNRAAVAQYLQYSYVPAPLSIARGVFKLPPGAYVQFSVSQLLDGDTCILDVRYYWQLSKQLYRPALLDEDSYFSTMHTAILNAVQKQLVSDVPLGAFLSGGIDSSTIVACMQAVSSTPVKTFTIGFHEAGYNEAEDAKRIANHLGTQHTELYLTAADALNVIPDLAHIYDEPFADSSQIPTVLVSQLAAQHVTVCLSGDGGDELFCGYNRYVWGDRIWRFLEVQPHIHRRVLKLILDRVPVRWWGPLFALLKKVNGNKFDFKLPAEKIAKLCRVLDAPTFVDFYTRLVTHWEDPEAVLIDFDASQQQQIWWDNAHTFSDNTLAMMFIDTMTYLPDDLLTKVDRASMAASLEVRVPFLDHTLVELAWRTPAHIRLRQQNGRGKVLLREILAQYMPSELFERPKMGFSVPVGDWLRGSLRDWAEALIDAKRLESQGIFRPAAIHEKWVEHLSLHSNCQYCLWNILMFQSWLDKELVDVS